jgi:hypothetical protein
MDRAIAALQRGADLSTMSAGQGSGDGASLQGDEAELITADNCEMVTEACRSQIDPVVLAWYFGDGVEIKAGFRLTPPQRDTIDRDLAIDAQLVSQGVRLSRRDALARYERREADPADTDDSALEIPAVPAPPAPGFPNEADTVRPDPLAKRRNPLAKPLQGSGAGSVAPGGQGALAGQQGASSEAPRIANYEAAAVEALAEARAKGLAPVIDRLLDALGETDEAVMREALAGLLADLPKLAAAAGSDADAGLVERILADAVGIGYHTAMFEEASR